MYIYYIYVCMYIYIIAYTKCECFLYKMSNKCVNNCLLDFLIFCTIDKL